MSKNRLVFKELDRLFRYGVAPSGDGALLGRYLVDRDESAFEALVARHGPMVLGVCRRILANASDADDAFQATFLTLVRKGRKLRDPDRLGPWLYGVATRVATRARTRALRHRHEPFVDVSDKSSANDDLSDIKPLLDAELARRSAKHRDVLVLCVFQGASAEEASLRLGCPVGTVKSRLARGRETLRDRLIRRGISPSVAALWGADSTFSLPVSHSLIYETLKSIEAATIAPAVGSGLRGVISGMFMKSTAAAIVLAGLAVAGIGTTTWVRNSRAQAPAGEANDAPGSRDPYKIERDNIKTIMLAFHNYHSNYNHLPTGSIYGSDGQPKLSWRVALLPFLGENTLYNEFKMNESWDSPHNKALIARMPAVYGSIDEQIPAGHTKIRGFAGTGAAFEGVRNIGFQDITDGTSNTVLIAVARDPVVWTKPGELSAEIPDPSSQLDIARGAGYRLGMCDGSYHLLPRHAAALLHDLISRAGGEVIQWPSAPRPIGPAPGAGLPMAGGATPTPAAVSPAPFPGAPSTEMQAFERRLHRLEQKLELLLRKLDAAQGAANTPRP
jgi:RNA polymerase sigma factor (sigma-70 family)